MDSLISVVMSVYNCDDYVTSAIESILNQSFRNIEFIIINDGSTDKSDEKILMFNDPRILYIKNEKNIGLIGSLNKAILISNGKYIVRMDADDISVYNRIERLVNFMDKNPDIGACSSYFEFGLETNNIIKYPVNDEEIYLNFLTGCPFGHAPAILRKKVLIEHNLSYDTDFEHSEDSNLWVRMLNVTKLANLPEILYRVRLHPGSITQLKKDQVQRSFNKSRNIHFKNICNKLGEESEMVPFPGYNPSFDYLKGLGKKILTLIGKNKKLGKFNSTMFEKYISLLWMEIINKNSPYKISNLFSLLSYRLIFYSDLRPRQKLNFIKKLILNSILKSN